MGWDRKWLKVKKFELNDWVCFVLVWLYFPASVESFWDITISLKADFALFSFNPANHQPTPAWHSSAPSCFVIYVIKSRSKQIMCAALGISARQLMGGWHKFFNNYFPKQSFVLVEANDNFFKNVFVVNTSLFIWLWL